jgi:hypothetical protein
MVRGQAGSRRNCEGFTAGEMDPIEMPNKRLMSGNGAKGELLCKLPIGLRRSGNTSIPLSCLILDQAWDQPADFCDIPLDSKQYAHPERVELGV